MINGSDFLKWLQVFNVPYGGGQPGSVTQKEVQESAFNFALASGANDAFEVDLFPAVTSLTDGLLVTMSTGALTNSTSTPTLEVNGLSPKVITFGGLQLEPGDIEANATYLMVYDLDNGYFNIINPSISIANTRLIQYNEYNSAVDTGIVNAYIADLTPPVGSLTSYLSLLCQIVNANTGSSTLTVNGNTAAIVTANNQPLVGGELIANQVALFVYNPTWAKFVLVNPMILSASMGGTGLTSTPTNGQVLIGNGTGYTLGTLTAGSDITITNGSGTITISSTASSLANAEYTIMLMGA